MNLTSHKSSFENDEATIADEEAVSHRERQVAGNESRK